jgi:DNA-binding beta-propeller fold protein YncE
MTEVSNRNMDIKNFLLLILCCFLYSGCKAQKTYGDDNLVLEKSISLSGVSGRIDHMDVNLKDRIVYIAALGNNSLEIVDIGKGKVLRSIKGLDEPQGVAFIPQQKEIFVANGGNGDCYFYNSDTYQKTATIHLTSDADDVRYDSTSEIIYVGYGNGGISVIDAKKHIQINDFKLSGHPEGFQVDRQLNKLFVNVPDAHQIAVIDLIQSKLTGKWSTGVLRDNFPVAIDPTNHYLFIGYRHPAKLVVVDGNTGNILNRSDLVTDVDDLHYDESDGKVYASGGGGFISIYQFRDRNLERIANIATKKGARTSLLIPELKLFILAERANGNNSAQLQVYKTK